MFVISFVNYAYIISALKKLNWNKLYTSLYVIILFIINVKAVSTLCFHKLTSPCCILAVSVSNARFIMFQNTCTLTCCCIIVFVTTGHWITRCMQLVLVWLEMRVPAMCPGLTLHWCLHGEGCDTVFFCHVRTRVCVCVCVCVCV